MRSTSCWSANYCSISRLPTPSCPSPLTSSHAFHPSGAPRLRHNNHEAKVAVLIIGLSYPLETALSNKITRNTIVLSFKDSPRKPLRRRPTECLLLGIGKLCFVGYRYPDMSTQMGREVLEGLRAMPKPTVPIIQENQQRHHCPSRE